VFDWVTVPEPWAYYDAQDMGGGEDGAHTVFHDAIEAVRAQRGANALDAFDGVVFLYAGPRQSLRGSQLWPHRASVRPANGGAVLHHRRRRRDVRLDRRPLPRIRPHLGLPDSTVTATVPASASSA